MAVVLSSILNISFAAINKDSCHDLMDKGTPLVTQTLGCALVKALLEELDIMDGSPEAVQDICNAKQSYNEEFLSLLLKNFR